MDLIVCPELAVPGYVFAGTSEARAVAEAPDGPTFQAIAPVARALGSWVVCGFVEADRDRLFNSAMVIDPAGERRFVYRKTLLFEEDERWASIGDSGYETFDTDSGDFAVAICMDLNDPALIDWLRARRPHALAFPTNWVQEGGGCLALLGLATRSHPDRSRRSEHLGCRGKHTVLRSFRDHAAAGPRRR